MSTKTWAHIINRKIRYATKSVEQVVGVLLTISIIFTPPTQREQIDCSHQNLHSGDLKFYPLDFKFCDLSYWLLSALKQQTMMMMMIFLNKGLEKVKKKGHLEGPQQNPLVRRRLAKILVSSSSCLIRAQLHKCLQPKAFFYTLRIVMRA